MSDSIKTVLLRVENGYYPADITSHRDIHMLAGRVKELERENAKLRSDRDRLDWLEELHCWPEYHDSEWGYSEWHYMGRSFPTFRAAIDAARKEQP